MPISQTVNYRNNVDAFNAIRGSASESTRLQHSQMRGFPRAVQPEDCSSKLWDCLAAAISHPSSSLPSAISFPIHFAAAILDMCCHKRRIRSPALCGAHQPPSSTELWRGNVVGIRKAENGLNRGPQNEKIFNNPRIFNVTIVAPGG